MNGAAIPAGKLRRLDQPDRFPDLDDAAAIVEASATDIAATPPKTPIARRNARS